MAWVLTKGLQNLRNQVNAAFPNRDKSSDGTIGDTRHQAETSGHNPDDTSGSRPEWNGDSDSTAEVRAFDLDSDLRRPDVTAQQLVDHIRKLPGVSGVLRYMIYNRKIYRASNGWKAEDYDGPSPHTEHIHLSGAYSQAADNDTSFNYRLEDLTMDLDDIRAVVRDELHTWVEVNPEGDPAKEAANPTGRVGGFIKMMEVRAKTRHEELEAKVDTLAKAVAELATVVKASTKP